MVSVDSNIGEVIGSVEDVQDDLHHEFQKRLSAAMRVLWADARQYVLDDPHTTGDLFSAVQNDSEIGGSELEFSVHVDLGMASYASIVEFGSGTRTELAWRGNDGIPGTWPDEGSSYPPGYPYESPDIDYNRLNPANTKGFPKFYGFTKYIQEWMEAKGLRPRTGSTFVSAAMIASTIIDRGQYAHPYLRPAWFENELKIKRAARHALRNATR